MAGRKKEAIQSEVNVKTRGEEEKKKGRRKGGSRTDGMGAMEGKERWRGKEEVKTSKRRTKWR